VRRPWTGRSRTGLRASAIRDRNRDAGCSDAVLDLFSEDNRARVRGGGRAGGLPCGRCTRTSTITTALSRAAIERHSSAWARWLLLPRPFGEGRFANGISRFVDPALASRPAAGPALRATRNPGHLDPASATSSRADRCPLRRQIERSRPRAVGHGRDRARARLAAGRRPADLRVHRPHSSTGLGPARRRTSWPICHPAC